MIFYKLCYYTYDDTHTHTDGLMGFRLFSDDVFEVVNREIIIVKL